MDKIKQQINASHPSLNHFCSLYQPTSTQYTQGFSFWGFPLQISFFVRPLSLLLT